MDEGLAHHIALFWTPEYHSAGLQTATRWLGPYQLIHRLARGGMGAVHLARRRGADVLCVLKELLEHAADDSDLERRFRREAHLTSLLDHCNIARILDAGTIDGRFYIAFEFVPGVSLAHLCRTLTDERRWLAPGLAVSIVLQILDGLGHAHERRGPDGRPLGLVHRDLTPSNVMIAFGGGVKIIDFGVASAQVDGHRTRPGRSLGTVPYMSPEQVRGPTVDARSDLYTVGVLLYELLTGRRVVARASYVAMLNSVVDRSPPPVSKVQNTLPAALDAVVEGALAKSPEDRWPDAHSFRQALLAAAGTLPDARVLPRMLASLFPATIAQTDAWRQAAREAARFERGVPGQHCATQIITNVADLSDTELEVDITGVAAPRPDAIDFLPPVEIEAPTVPTQTSGAKSSARTESLADPDASTTTDHPPRPPRPDAVPTTAVPAGSKMTLARDPAHSSPTDPNSANPSSANPSSANPSSENPSSANPSPAESSPTDSSATKMNPNPSGLGPVVFNAEPIERAGPTVLLAEPEIPPAKHRGTIAAVMVFVAVALVTAVAIRGAQMNAGSTKTVRSAPKASTRPPRPVIRALAPAGRVSGERAPDATQHATQDAGPPSADARPTDRNP